jgi:hypothetical protein
MTNPAPSPAPAAAPAPSGPALVTSTCIGCGANDNHPKHVVVIGPEHESVAWHMDCHARASVVCDVCTSQTKGASGLTGDALRTHLIGLPAHSSSKPAPSAPAAPAPAAPAGV